MENLKSNIHNFIIWEKACKKTDIILQKIEFDYGFPTGPYINYKVHRAKHNDIVLFEQENLEKIKGEENND